MYKRLVAEDIFTLSIGTGNRLQESESAKNWFKLKWINPLLEIMMAADGGVVHYEMSKIYQSVGKPKNYYRITGQLPDTIDKDMACATTTNLNELHKFAKELVKTHRYRIQEIAEKLKS